jgi:hypothetical protein
MILVINPCLGTIEPDDNGYQGDIVKYYKKIAGTEGRS